MTKTKLKELGRENLTLARKIYAGMINAPLLGVLKSFSGQLGLSVRDGDLILLNQRWYVTHSGLIRLARRKRCVGIHTSPVSAFSDPPSSAWAFKATVYKTSTCKGFVGFGDANPSNVSPPFHGAEMRIAETRAVNRALRKAYGIGLCSVEEIGAFSGSPEATTQKGKISPQPVPTNGNGHPLRDRLCLLIRRHNLDAGLVKAYAADFCGAKELRDAGREKVEEFIEHLAASAENDRAGLLCQLNAYAQKQEGAA